MADNTVKLDPNAAAAINNSKAAFANTMARMNGNSTLPPASIWPTGSLPNNMQGSSNNFQTLPLVPSCNFFSCGGYNFDYGGNTSLATVMNLASQTNALICNCNNSIVNAQFGNNQNNNQPKINLSDVTNRFNDLDETKLKNMSDMESKINKLNNVFDKLDDGTALTDEDKKFLEEQKLIEEGKNADKEKVAEALNKLKDEYRKLDSEYGDLSTTYGDEFKFYGNLDKLELDDIKKQNGKISRLRKELEQKQTKLKEIREELTVKANEASKKAGKPVTNWSDFCSKDEKNRHDNVEKQIADLEKKLSDSIDANSAYIKKAGKTTETERFESFKVKHEREKAAAAKEAKESETASELANSFFDNEGNRVSKDKITDKLKAMNGYDNAEKDKVADFIYSQIGDKSKDAFLKYLNDDKFFEAIQKSQDPNFMKNLDNLKLLRDVYDKLSSTKLKDAVKDAKTASHKAFIKFALEKLEKPAAQKTEAQTPADKSAETTTAATSTSTAPKTEAKKPAEQKPSFNANTIVSDLITKNTKDNTINWSEIKKAIDTGNYSDDAKNKLKEEYKKQRTTAEMQQIIAENTDNDTGKINIINIMTAQKTEDSDTEIVNSLIHEATKKEAARSFTEAVADSNKVKAARDLRTNFPGLSYEECYEIVKSTLGEDKARKIPLHTDVEIEDMLNKGNTSMSANDLIRYFSESQKVNTTIQNLKNQNRFEALKNIIAKLNNAADSGDNSQRICFDQDCCTFNEVHYMQPYDDKIAIDDSFDYSKLDMMRCVSDVTNATIEMAKNLKKHIEF